MVLVLGVAGELLMVMSQPAMRAVAVVLLVAADAQKLLVGEVLVGDVSTVQVTSGGELYLDPAGFQSLG